MTALGGRIEVESSLGEGTTLRIVLPAAPAEATRAPAPTKQPAASATGARVLVVDDERLILKTLQRLLESRGFQVVTAETGRGALEAVAGSAFDVVLCDLMMPEFTGMDVHAELTKSRPDVAKRVVFLTGGAFTDRAATYLENIDNLKLTKPFDLEELLAVVTRVAATS